MDSQGLKSFAAEIEAQFAFLCDRRHVSGSRVDPNYTVRLGWGEDAEHDYVFEVPKIAWIMSDVPWSMYVNEVARRAAQRT